MDGLVGTNGPLWPFVNGAGWRDAAMDGGARPGGIRPGVHGHRGTDPAGGVAPQGGSRNRPYTETTNTETTNSETTNSETTNNETTNSQTANSETANSQTAP
jgi:hypothetical protein